MEALPYHGVLLDIKNKQRNIYTCNNLDKFPENYAEWKKPVSKDYKLYIHPT